MKKKIPPIFYIFTISSRSNEFSNSSNSFFISFSINFNKLEGGLQPTLGSLRPFLFTKINFSRLFDYKGHFLRFVSNLKDFCDPTMHKI